MKICASFDSAASAFSAYTKQGRKCRIATVATRDTNSADTRSWNACGWPQRYNFGRTLARRWRQPPPRHKSSCSEARVSCGSKWENVLFQACSLRCTHPLGKKIMDMSSVGCVTNQVHVSWNDELATMWYTFKCGCHVFSGSNA